MKYPVILIADEPAVRIFEESVIDVLRIRLVIFTIFFIHGNLQFYFQ